MVLAGGGGGWLPDLDAVCPGAGYSHPLGRFLILKYNLSELPVDVSIEEDHVCNELSDTPGM